MANDRVPLTQEVAVQPDMVESQTENVAQTEPIKPPSPVNFLDYPDYHRIADFFDVNLEERNNETLANELSLLWDWGKEQVKSDDRLQVSLALKDLAKRIGVPEVGPTLVKKLYQWIRLDFDRKRIEQKMELLKAKYA